MIWRPRLERQVDFEHAFRAPLEDYLDMNEAMFVFADRQDLGLMPPESTDQTGGKGRDTIEMPAWQFRNMIGA